MDQPFDIVKFCELSNAAAPTIHTGIDADGNWQMWSTAAPESDRQAFAEYVGQFDWAKPSVEKSGKDG